MCACSQCLLPIRVDTFSKNNVLEGDHYELVLRWVVELFVLSSSWIFVIEMSTLLPINRPSIQTVRASIANQVTQVIVGFISLPLSPSLSFSLSLSPFLSLSLSLSISPYTYLLPV
jgi:hypothetical protein